MMGPLYFYPNLNISIILILTLNHSTFLMVSHLRKCAISFGPPKFIKLVIRTKTEDQRVLVKEKVSEKNNDPSQVPNINHIICHKRSKKRNCTRNYPTNFTTVSKKYSLC